MRKALGLAAIALLCAMPAAAQKISIDYSHDYDFDSVKTFQYVDAEDATAPNPLMHDRIVDAIKRELKEGGLAEVSENPDLYVTYQISAEDNTVYNTSGFGYGGYWGGWGPYGGGMTSTTTYATTFTEGTLIVDGYDAQEKKLVWRGAGTVTVKEKPDKQTKQVDSILDKMGKKWKKIHAGQGK
jgi:hypothetical protein